MGGPRECIADIASCDWSTKSLRLRDRFGAGLIEAWGGEGISYWKGGTGAWSAGAGDIWFANEGYVMGPVESAPLRGGGEARGGDDRSDLLREMEIEFRTIAGRRERLPCMPLGPFEV